MSHPFIDKDNPLILASTSPRRKSLLAQVRLPFRSETSLVIEEGNFGNPDQTVGLLAEKKARDVYARISGHWILGADTVVAIDSTDLDVTPMQDEGTAIILGKPKDKTEARLMLRLLSGREHRVTTGICILTPSGEAAHAEAITTRVSIKELTDQEIEAYIHTKESFGKAGGYAIQGIASFMVKSISGSYTNVVGLPMYAVIKALVAAGALQGFPLPP